MSSDIHVILPEPTLRRLPWYLAYLDTLEHRRVENVSSTTISKALNVDSSQIAKDLSFLNLKGKTRIGYNVKALRQALSSFLDFGTSHGAYVIGAGSLGQALIRDTGLANYGLKILAAFDVQSYKIGRKISEVPVYHLDELPRIMAEDPASVAILTVPAQNAQDVADAAIDAGIKAIWNFTPYRINVPEGVVMSSTSIYANLALIYNRLKAKETTTDAEDVIAN
ncbi:MAG: redox-sensing transcriptional repressor Rex [Clostridium sp.]|nr:redox-sensing transcriptional repressor Rex [Prevotella sp.]MCM1429517.1 redox-sensing transcriptional repressor Rex [Clostridium sp.]MCM1476133.1 redox-sensing transcriptional repressor Rex [Muribaculaceae bacterium]